jgi:hypothetical protein
MSTFARAINRVLGQSRAGAATVHATIPCDQCFIDPPPFVRQPTVLSCWAAAAAMLVGAHDKVSISIDTVLARGAWSDPGGGVPPPPDASTLTDLKFFLNHTIPHKKYAFFLQQLGMSVVPGYSITPAALCDLLKQHGPLGVTIDVGAGSITHEIVIYGMSFDPDEGCGLNYHDPGKGEAQSMTFASFDSLHGAQASAAVNFFYY